MHAATKTRSSCEFRVSSDLLEVIQRRKLFSLSFSWPRNGLAEVGKMIVSSLPSKERVVKKSANCLVVKPRSEESV
jgi:hypothetical protein